MTERISNITSGARPGGTSSERAAFEALLRNKEALGLREIFQCHGVFADGYLVDKDGKYIAVEIKETLGWHQLMSACFQIVSMNNLKSLNATNAWIIYEEPSREWKERHGELIMEHANRCIGSFKVGLNIRFMQLLPTGEFKHTGGVEGAA